MEKLTVIENNTVINNTVYAKIIFCWQHELYYIEVKLLTIQAYAIYKLGSLILLSIYPRSDIFQK